MDDNIILLLLVIAGLILATGAAETLTPPAASGDSGTTEPSGLPADVSMSSPPSVSGNYTAAAIAQLAAWAGFTGAALIIATAIALAESSGNPNAHGDIGIGQGSFGLWQINAYYHPEYGPDFTKLYDPETNANAAYAIYLAAGSSFSPWSTFKNRAYMTYYSAAQNAVGA